MDLNKTDTGDESCFQYDFPTIDDLKNDLEVSDFFPALRELFQKESAATIRDEAIYFFKKKFGLVSEREYGASNAENKFQQMCLYCSHLHRSVSDCGYHLLQKINPKSVRNFGRVRREYVLPSDGIYCCFCKATVPADAIIKHFALKDYKCITKILNAAPQGSKITDIKQRIEIGISKELLAFISLSFLFPLSNYLKDIVMVLYFFLADENNVKIKMPCISHQELQNISDLLDHAYEVTPELASELAIPSLLRKSHWRKGAKLIIESSLSNKTLQSQESYETFSSSFSTLEKLKEDQVFLRELQIFKPELTERACISIGEIKEIFLCFYVRYQCRVEFLEFFNSVRSDLSVCYKAVIFKQMKTKLDYMINFDFNDVSYVDVVRTLADCDYSEPEDDCNPACLATAQFFSCFYFSSKPWNVWIGSERSNTDYSRECPCTFNVEIITKDRIKAVNVGFYDETSNSGVIVSLCTKGYEIDDSSMSTCFGQLGDVLIHTRRIAPVAGMHNATFLTILKRLSQTDDSILDVSFVRGDKRLTTKPDENILFKDWLDSINDEGVATIFSFLHCPY